MEGVFISYISADSGGDEFLGTIPGSRVEVKKRNITSRIVISNPIASTVYQEETFLPSLIRFLMVEYILIQKEIAGPAIKTVDSNKDATSGPKTSLPPQKNLLFPFQT